MKPLGCFGFILRYAERRAEGRAFSFVMHQRRYTMLNGSMVKASTVAVCKWGDTTFLAMSVSLPCIG